MKRKWWTLIAASAATFMLLLDITVVNVALPSIRQDLGASFTDLQWVVDAYALTLAALVLTAGSLADRLGRALQGMGGAGDVRRLSALIALALIAQEFPAGRQRGTAVGCTAPRSAWRSRSARWWVGRSPMGSAGRRSSTSTSPSGLRRSRSPI